MLIGEHSARWARTFRYHPNIIHIRVKGYIIGDVSDKPAINIFVAINFVVLSCKVLAPEKTHIKRLDCQNP